MVVRVAIAAHDFSLAREKLAAHRRLVPKLGQRSAEIDRIISPTFLERGWRNPATLAARLDWRRMSIPIPSMRDPNQHASAGSASASPVNPPRPQPPRDYPKQWLDGKARNSDNPCRGDCRRKPRRVPEASIHRNSKSTRPTCLACGKGSGNVPLCAPEVAQDLTYHRAHADSVIVTRVTKLTIMRLANGFRSA